jgi:hypothetical protein
LGEPNDIGSVLSSNQKLSKARKAKLGGPMDLEEIRMNKNLLIEISKMKKEQTNRNSPSRGPDTDINELSRQINNEQ